MLKATTSTMLTSAMGLAWTLIKTGERFVAYAQSWELHEGNERRAGFVELAVWRAGNVILKAGQQLELTVNACAMRHGYTDSEVSGMVAWGQSAS